MRQEDLLREVRDAIRANTEAVKELALRVSLQNYPMYHLNYDGEFNSLSSPSVPEMLEDENRTGQDEKFMGVTGEEARQMQFPFPD